MKDKATDLKDEASDLAGEVEDTENRLNAFEDQADEDETLIREVKLNLPYFLCSLYCLFNHLYKFSLAVIKGVKIQVSMMP